MSHQQPGREDQSPGLAEGIKYGDVFSVTGDLAGQPIAPQDAFTLQSAEAVMFGQTQPGGAAAVMQSAATLNQYAGAVGLDQASDGLHNQVVTVTETPIPGGRIVTEFVAGQVVGQYVAADAAAGGGGGGVDDASAGDGGWDLDDTDKITVGEALEASARAVGNRPVEQSDASAIRAAEKRATGINVTMPGGEADHAQAAANANAWATRDETKIKLGDFLSDAAAKLADDKPADGDDAARAVEAELCDKPGARTRPGGVARAVVTAARQNQE